MAHDNAALVRVAQIENLHHLLPDRAHEKGLRPGQKLGFIPLAKTGGARVSARWQPACGALARVNVMNRQLMRVLYSGSVQGVGFRYTVKTVASGFEVTGTVRNLPDGSVELMAEAAKTELAAFRQAIRESGLEHFIRNEDISWSEAKGEFRGFEIVR